MGKIGNEEFCIPDLDSHDVVDNTCPCYVTHINKIVTNTFLYGRLHNFFNEAIKFRVAKLHGDEAMFPRDSATFFSLILLPSLESKIDPQEYKTISNINHFRRFYQTVFT